MLPQVLARVDGGILSAAGLRHLLEGALALVVHVKADDVDDGLNIRFVEVLGGLHRIPAAGFNPVADHIDDVFHVRSEEHTSELQSQSNLVCRLLLEKKKKTKK